MVRTTPTACGYLNYDVCYGNRNATYQRRQRGIYVNFPGLKRDLHTSVSQTRRVFRPSLPCIDDTQGSFIKRLHHSARQPVRRIAVAPGSVSFVRKTTVYLVILGIMCTAVRGMRRYCATVVFLRSRGGRRSHVHVYGV